MYSKELPLELLPYKERLSKRFFQAREQVVEFIEQDVIPALPTWNKERSELERNAPHPTMAPMPPTHWKLVEKAKKKGLWNFFLPEVCGLSVLEYSPIQELLGTIPQANFAMNCSAPDTGNMEVLGTFEPLSFCSCSFLLIMRLCGLLCCRKIWNTSTKEKMA